MFLQIVISSLLYSSIGAFTPSVTYVSFISSNLPIHDINESTIIRSEVLITNSDDSPLVELKLPFVFPYFGDFIDSVYVSPNGFVQTSAAALSSPYFSNPCDLKYDGIIAGFLTDFTTHTPSHQSNISVLQNEEVTSIRFRKLNIWGYVNATHPQFDFDVNLHSDGTVILNYIQVTGLISPTIVVKCWWFTGLVAPNYTTATGRAAITSDQKEIQNSVWNAIVEGVYPPTRENVMNDARFIACPMSTAWCASPAVIHSATRIVNITTLSIGCIQRQHEDFNSTIDIAVQVESSSSPVFSIDMSHLAPCSPILTDEPLTSAPVAFQCDVSGIAFSSYVSVGTVYLHLLWKPVGSSHLSYAAVGETVPPVPVTYASSAPPASTCALNQAVGSCASCDVCHSHMDPSPLNCLTLACPSTTQFITNASFESFSSSDELRSLYASPSCSNSCAQTFEEQFDKLGVCCAVKDIDCLGVCRGSALAGISEAGEEGYGVCCQVDKPPDCLGVCGGEAVIDTCNECNGNDTGVRCPTGFEVDTGDNVLHSNKHLATMYDAVNASYVSLVHVIVSNIFNTSVFVTITEKPKEVKARKVFGPVFELDEGVYEVLPNSSYTFDILSNVSGLFTGELDGWEVKTLSIRYQRPSRFDAFLDYHIDVLPASFNCEGQSRFEVCLGLPGCIHCLWQEGNIRTLRALPDASESNSEEMENDALDYYYPTKRMLYPEILPDFAGIDDFETSEGFCVTGFGNTACPFEISAATRSGGSVCKCLGFLAVLFVTCIL